MGILTRNCYTIIITFLLFDGKCAGESTESSILKYDNTQSTTFNYNITLYNGTGSSEQDSQTEDPAWFILFNRIQASVTTIGLVFNVVTFITLKLNGVMFSPLVKLLLMHQSVIDAVVCLFATLILAVPPMMVVGKNVVSLLICQCWHSQATYWCVMFISINNLVVLAWERFMAITKPFKHAEIGRSVIYKSIGCLYALSPVAMCLCFVQVHYYDGACLPEFYFVSPAFKTVMTGFGIWCFLCLYAIPCAFFFLFYGSIIYTLVSRQQQTDLVQSRVIDTATKQLTRTAMVVTGWFIISLGYDCWYYMLGYAGVVVYIKNSAVQKAGIFLAMSNSMANPLIYALFMPAYRQSLRKTFGCAEQSKKLNGAFSTRSVATISSTI